MKLFIPPKQIFFPTEFNFVKKTTKNLILLCVGPKGVFQFSDTKSKKNSPVEKTLELGLKGLSFNIWMETVFLGVPDKTYLPLGDPLFAYMSGDTSPLPHGNSVRIRPINDSWIIWWGHKEWGRSPHTLGVILKSTYRRSVHHWLSSLSAALNKNSAPCAGICLRVGWTVVSHHCQWRAFEWPTQIQAWHMWIPPGRVLVCSRSTHCPLVVLAGTRSLLMYIKKPWTQQYTLRAGIYM